MLELIFILINNNFDFDQVSINIIFEQFEDKFLNIDNLLFLQIWKIYNILKNNFRNIKVIQKIFFEKNFFFICPEFLEKKNILEIEFLKCKKNLSNLEIQIMVKKNIFNNINLKIKWNDGEICEKEYFIDKNRVILFINKIPGNERNLEMELFWNFSKNSKNFDIFIQKIILNKI